MKQLSPTYQPNIYTSEKFDKGSRIVYGTSGIGGVWGDVNEQESIDCLLYAFENGITSLDTAPSYSRSEEFVGKALRQWKGEKLFISTKVGRLPAQQAEECYVDYSPERMKQSVLSSLEKLGLDKIDLLFLHEPHLVPLDKIEEILETLQSFKEAGYTERIGVGGNPTDLFRPYITKNNFEVVSSFLKVDACNLSGFKTDIPHFQSQDIAYYAASALHMGLLGQRFAKHVANPPNTKWVTNRDVAIAQKVNTIAKKYQLSMASLSQRYLFSIKQADRVVMGACNQLQIENTVNDWREGALPRNIFNEITETILNHQ